VAHSTPISVTELIELRISMTYHSLTATGGRRSSDLTAPDD
jgi:hypothetical protein